MIVVGVMWPDMKQNYCYHPKDYFPLTAFPEVFYSSFIPQQQFSSIQKVHL